MQVPSRKWFITQVTAISAWLIALIENGMRFDSTLAIAAVGIGSQALIAYLVPNSDSGDEVVADIGDGR